MLLRATGELPRIRARARRSRADHDRDGRQFWNGQQVGDLLAYLRAVANPLDELALYSTLASPLVGLSSAALARGNKGARAAEWRLGDDPEPDIGDFERCMPPS